MGMLQGPSETLEQTTSAIFDDSFGDNLRKASTGNGAVEGVGEIIVFVNLKKERLSACQNEELDNRALAVHLC